MVGFSLDEGGYVLLYWIERLYALLLPALPPRMWLVFIVSVLLCCFSFICRKVLVVWVICSNCVM